MPIHGLTMFEWRLVRCCRGVGVKSTVANRHSVNLQSAVCNRHYSDELLAPAGYTGTFRLSRGRATMTDSPSQPAPPENLIIETDAGVAVVTINRPKVLNALNTQTLDELRRTILALQRDDAVRVVVLTGAGEKSFVAGADINELAVQTPTSGREHAIRGQHVLDLIEQMGKPVIAAINGYALGGGCELAMACTIRLAADTATLGQPEINLGLVPGYGGTQRLARIVGKGRALELLLSGDRITAQEAYRIGLVNRVVPAGELMAAARAPLGDASPFRFALIVSRFNEAITGSLRDAAVRALREAGAAAANVHVFDVPGAYEVPQAARAAADTGLFDAVVCLGCVIRGETPHFEYIASAVAHGITS